MDVRLPDGRIAKNVPDDMTQDEILAHVRKVDAEASGKMALEGMGPLEKSFAGAGKLWKDSGLAMKQAVARPLRAFGFAKDWADSVDEDGRQTDARDAALMDTPEGKIGYMTSAIAPGMSVVSNAPRVAAAVGAAQSAFIPTDNEAQRAGNILGGAAMGGISQWGANKLFGPAVEKAAQSVPNASGVREAKARGFALSPAQETGSKAQSAFEGVLASLPGSAGTMAEKRGAQLAKYTGDVLGTMGETGTAVAEGGAATIKANIGKRLEDAAKGVTLKVDDNLLTRLAAVEQEYGKNLAADQRPLVKQYLDDILSTGGEFTGEQYQKWRSRIGQRAAGTSDSEFKGALKGIQKALDSAFDEQAPAEAQAAMKAARGQYRNAKTLEPLLEEASLKGGSISPLKVAGRAAVSKNTGGEVADLARVGQVIGKEYPNSGTPARHFFQNALTFGVPAAAGGAAGAGASGDPVGAAIGSVGGLAAGFLVPKAAAAAYFSKPIRDILTKPASPPSALSHFLRQRALMDALEATGGRIAGPGMATLQAD